MKRRSKRHHEIPQWLLGRFCVGETAQLWVGFKNTGEVRLLHVKSAFVRKDGNTRTDFVATGGGRAKRVRSSRDEKILADFDGRTSAAARSAITWGRAYRAKPQIATALAPAHVHVLKQLIVGQARRTQESQDRIALTSGLDDMILDAAYERAAAVGQRLPSRSDLRSATEVQEWWPTCVRTCAPFRLGRSCDPTRQGVRVPVQERIDRRGSSDFGAKLRHREFRDHNHRIGNS